MKTYAAVSASDDDAEMAVFLYREAAMRRVLGLMLFCFGIGMTASFVYSGDVVYADLYYRMPDPWVLSVLRMS